MMKLSKSERLRLARLSVRDRSPADNHDASYPQEFPMNEGIDTCPSLGEMPSAAHRCKCGSQQERQEPRDRISKPDGDTSLLIFREIELGTEGEIPLKVLLQLCGEALAIEHRLQVIINTEAADVDILGANGAACGRC